MKNIFIMTIVAIVVLLLIAVGTWFVRDAGGMSKGASLPVEKFEELPMEIGDFNGEDTQLDERLFRRISAAEAISRSYADSSGKVITLHGSIIGHFVRAIPHSPTVCYPVAGWTLIEQKQVKVDVPGGKPIDVTSVIYEMNGQRIMIFFWYQFGDEVVGDSIGLSKVLKKYRSADSWPSLIKFLIQATVTTPEQTEEVLKSFTVDIQKLAENAQENGFSGKRIKKSVPAEKPPVKKDEVKESAPKDKKATEAAAEKK
jgi:EpsI family protein